MDFTAYQKNWTARRSGNSGKRPFDKRNDYVRDRARIIHSAAFRRLQSKTQVLGIGEGDFRRTRLTHSMEVAQIGSGIVLYLRKNIKEDHNDNLESIRTKLQILPDIYLIEALGLAHDLGHPPFGHSGEIALNYKMAGHGGFEGNGQTIRLVSKLESYDDNFGLDLTRRTILGLLKYPAPYSKVAKTSSPVPPKNGEFIYRKDWKPPKCFMDSETDVFEWLIKPFKEEDKQTYSELKGVPSADHHGKTKYKTVDASIVEVADDIAYSTHDLEDGITLRLITKGNFESLWNEFMQNKENASWTKKYDIYNIDQLLFDNSGSRKRGVGSLVNALINSTYIKEITCFEDPLLKYNIKLIKPAKDIIGKLRNMTSDCMIKIQQVQTSEFRGRHIVTSIFDAICSDPTRMMKKYFASKFSQSKTDDDGQRIICDYISGMTDEYATKIYERFFVPRQGSVFERL